MPNKETERSLPTAKVVCDSVSPAGSRITTLEVRMHRFVLAEFNTHCLFARNSASSRALPMEGYRNGVLKDPAMPVEWGKNQSGMQARELLSSAGQLEVEKIWRELLAVAAGAHSWLDIHGLHKQLTNRLLELWAWHTVIVTSETFGFENFFWQRCHEDAQPEMKTCADAMQLAYYRSTPKSLSYGDWHLPYIHNELGEDCQNFTMEDLCAISAARCARVSYLTHAGNRNTSEDLDLYSRLTAPNAGHWSPLEHVATPTHPEHWYFEGESPILPSREGKFPGWVQLRHLVETPRGRFIPNHPDLRDIALALTLRHGKHSDVLKLYESSYKSHIRLSEGE